ncbi:MAG: efflux RND transporter periplasmic adaptor subunit [Flavobacteriales bacterium]
MKTLKYIALISATAFLFSACGDTEQASSKEDHHDEESNTVELTEAQYKVAGIELGNIENRSLSGTIQANGFLDVPPQSKVTISAPMAGFVKETEMLQGAYVKKGQAIAVLQHPDYIQMQQDYLESSSQLEFLKNEYERQQQLAKENVSSQKVLQQAKANYITNKAKADGLRAKLQLLNINVSALENGNMQSTINLYAPIEGYVTKVNVNIGAFVNPTDMMFEIVNTEHLHAELTIFEKDVPRLRIGQKVLFTLANEATQRKAVVYLIGREINADRTVQIHCHIDKEDKEFLPGMYLKAMVETDNALVPALPDEAIVSFEGKKYIFTLGAKQGNEQHFNMVEIQSGLSEVGFTEVILPKSMDSKQKIVVKGAYNLLAKMKNSEEGEGHAH